MPGGAFMLLWAIELTAHFLALLATYMNRDRDNQLVNGAILNMKTIIIPPPTFPSERQPIRVKTPIRTSLVPDWQERSFGSDLGRACWSQIVLGFGFLPVVKLLLQPVLISRERSQWSAYNFFPFLGNFLDLFFLGGIYFFVTNASKSLSFQP